MDIGKHKLQNIMANYFNIPSEIEEKIRLRDKICVYCSKEMIYPYNIYKRSDSATIEHLKFDGPFYWKDGLDETGIAICCGSCNSSRGPKKLSEWFKTPYCIDRKINKDTVADPIKRFVEMYPEL